jgi:chromosome segregation ATPase
MALKIGVREALAHFVEKAKEWGMSPIPDAERLQIVLDRMRKDVAAKRLAYQEALAAVVAIQDPEDAKRGQLPALRARLKKYEKKGAEWGAEYKEEETAGQKRADLMARMQEASTNIQSVKTEIFSLEQVLATQKETLELRKKAYEQAKADYEKLRFHGASLVAQAKALREAQEERARAIEASAGEAGTDSAAIMAELEEALEDARASERAAELIEGDAREVPLDEIIAAEEKAAAADETISGWIQ